ncbi:hypothetical protein BCON_0223g00140 [Botryotinia convoluta]|uniref:Heterokaryon incompatibility domain-containing protein n=1 Tax=Botryotinia convoluta TaxID=54673 RepID=A0A4Z1HWB9_9HELO|nr:hypothetical protein BCON_0223g00140 [Botryotinia convoluta]
MVKPNAFSTMNYRPGSASDERRFFTPPLRPELSEEFRFCCKVKTEFSNAFGQSDSWQLSAEQTSFQVQYLRKLELTLHHSSYESKRVRFYVAASSSDWCQEWLRIENIPLGEENSFTETKAAIVQDWVKQCALNSECSRISELFESPSTPSHLFDIGSKDDNDYFIKLVDTKTFNLSRYALLIRYICLSYCWGTDGKLPRTTKENVEQHKEQISINLNMPLLFRDTISVTRKLGYGYNSPEYESRVFRCQSYFVGEPKEGLSQDVQNGLGFGLGLGGGLAAVLGFAWLLRWVRKRKAMKSGGKGGENAEGQSSATTRSETEVDSNEITEVGITVGSSREPEIRVNSIAEVSRAVV